HQNQHLIYDVMQAEYIRQMIDWCEEKNLKYDYRILYFLPKSSDESTQIMKSRNTSETEFSIKVRLKRDTSLDSYKKYNVYPNYVLNNYDYKSFPKDLLKEIYEIDQTGEGLIRLLKERAK
ncbi:MAG: hypothetical protein JXR30_01135, partial [Alphaproteobacteria bacterium]|nr:hypothetical protein [Alphaproteobacteria bacterium]